MITKLGLAAAVGIATLGSASAAHAAPCQGTYGGPVYQQRVYQQPVYPVYRPVYRPVYGRVWVGSHHRPFHRW
jgi:hypothetical protein